MLTIVMLTKVMLTIVMLTKVMLTTVMLTWMLSVSPLPFLGCPASVLGCGMVRPFTLV